MLNDTIHQHPLSGHAIKQQKEDGRESYLVNQAVDEAANSLITVLGSAMSVSSLQETGEVTWVLGLSTNGDLTMNGVLMTNTSIHIPFKLDPSANRFEMSPNLPRG